MTDLTPSEHITILMCTRNGEQWLQEQLDSFLRQDHDNWTLWASDDDSTDGTLDILARFAARHPRRVGRILQGARKGLARNYLKMVCHPDLPCGFVAFSDQDDVWMPHKLSRALIRLREAGESPCAWAGRYLVTGPDLSPRFIAGSWPRDPSFGNAVVQNILSGHTLTLNPAAFALVRRAGVPDVPYHDWWIYLLMTATRARIIVDEAVVLRYRQHGENAIGVHSSPRGRLKRLRMLLRGDHGRWIGANLRALKDTDAGIDLPVVAFAHNWLGAKPLDKSRLINDFAIYRQSRLETALIHLASRLGRI